MILDAYVESVLILTGVNMMLALSLYPLMVAGQDSLGQGGFMALGAYTAAALTTMGGQPFLLTVAAGGILAGGVALLVGFPALRLRGIYIALLTLGFGEIVRVLFLNLPVTGGAGGLGGIPRRTTLPLVAAGVICTLLGTALVSRSALGRTLRAIQEDEAAARAMGVRAVRVKMGAFAAGGMIAGVAGGLYAHYALFIDPATFGLRRSIEIFVFAVIGGAVVPWGPAAGAAALTILPELFRFGQDWRQELYGIAMLLVALLRPMGLAGARIWPRRQVHPPAMGREP